ncbi:MAG TPA: hypothetical protein VNJ11_06585 [Bryobacteraceae bacterium]|nr:hypothetical protein [Bryobacteraceae bacterium]
MGRLIAFGILGIPMLDLSSRLIAQETCPRAMEAVEASEPGQRNALRRLEARGGKATTALGKKRPGGDYEVCAALFLAAAVTALCEQGQLRLTSRTAIPEVPQQGLVRLWLCPSGLVVITERRGEVILVDGPREAVIYHKTLPELAGVEGGTCDDQQRIYFSIHSPEAAFVRTYSLSPQGELKFDRAFPSTGRMERLLVVGRHLYAVGLARTGSAHVFLRRFQLPEEPYLDSPPVKVPAGRELVNYFAVQGSLFWHPGRKQVVYVPANPFEFWCLDENGKVAAAHRPQVANFINAPPGASGNRDFHMYDTVYNAAALPDGRIVAQVLTGAARPKRQTFLVILDSEFQPAGAELPMAPEFGLLVGVTADATLYFADHVKPGGTFLVKARLRP